MSGWRVFVTKNTVLVTVDGLFIRKPDILVDFQMIQEFRCNCIRLGKTSGVILEDDYYLDGVSPGSVTSSHIAVALGHSGADGQVAVLTVHVVGSGPKR